VKLKSRENRSVSAFAVMMAPQIDRSAPPGHQFARRQKLETRKLRVQIFKLKNAAAAAGGINHNASPFNNL